MKTSILLFTLLMTTQRIVFAQLAFDNAHETLKSQLVNGLKQNDAAALVALFPELEELYALMDVNAGFYSTRLNDAKATLLTDYEKIILPQAKQAFEHLLAQGKAKGIDWHTIEAMEVVRLVQPLSTGVIHLRFHANGIAFNMEAKLFTRTDGQFKLTQFIKFI